MPFMYHDTCLNIFVLLYHFHPDYYGGEKCVMTGCRNVAKFCCDTSVSKLCGSHFKQIVFLGIAEYDLSEAIDILLD